MMVNEICEKKYNKPLSGCTNEEIYYALLDMTKDLAAKKKSEAGKKKVYYISAEFLIGKLLSNNLINLGLYKTVKEELEAAGKDISEIEEIEPEPSLGNGGLGRLAACFLDSMATLNLHGDGVGLNYHMGLFKQVFDHNFQKETPNPKVMLEIGLASICFPAWKAQPVAPVPRQKPRQVEQPDAWQEDVPPPGDREAPPEPVSIGSKEKTVNLGQGAASKWNEFLDEIRTDGKMMIYSNLLLARPQEVAGGMDIVFTADKKGNRDLINHFENIQYLEEVAARVIGPGMRIKLLLEEESSSAAPQGLSAMDLAKKFPDLVQIEEEEN